MWGWTKRRRQRSDAFELWFWRRLLRESLDSTEIKPVNSKGNEPWIFIERTDIEAEAPILWLPDAKSWLIWKDPDAGKGWGQEEKGAIEDWDGWMASPTQWRWIWVNSGNCWWTGRPGMLQSMGSQIVGHDWAELNLCRTSSSWLKKTEYVLKE